MGRDHQTIGVPGAPHRNKGRILRSAGCGSPHLTCRATNQPPGKVALGGGHQRPRDSDPAPTTASAKRERAPGGGGPRLLKGGLAATRNPRPHLSLPKKPVRRLFLCPAYPRSESRAGAATRSWAGVWRRLAGIGARA